MKKYVVIFVFIFSISGVFAQDSSGKLVLAPEKYEAHIQNDSVQFVDVRTAKEYEEGHIEGAENIDFFSDDFIKEFEEFNKEEPVYIYCRSGNRSAKAAKKLSEAGFKTIIDLQGGYKAWINAKQQ